MTKAEMTVAVCSALQDAAIESPRMALVVSDVIQDVMNYCNIEEIPESLEPFVRRKALGIIDYEAANGTGWKAPITSIHEGDGSLNFATDGSGSREYIFNINSDDAKILKRFRRLRHG